MKKALCICFALLTIIVVLASCGEDPAKDIRACYVDSEGIAMDIRTGKSFVAVAAVEKAGYYNVAGDGTVKGEADIKEGVITSVDTDGTEVGFEGKVVFLENGKESAKKPWGVAFSELNAKLTMMKTLYGTDPTVTFSYIAVDGVNYVLIDTIKVK